MFERYECVEIHPIIRSELGILVGEGGTGVRVGGTGVRVGGIGVRVGGTGVRAAVGLVLDVGLPAEP